MNTEGLWRWIADSLKWGVVVLLAIGFVLSIYEKRYGRLIGVAIVGAFAFGFLGYPREFLEVLSIPFKILFGVG